MTVARNPAPSVLTAAVITAISLSSAGCTLPGEAQPQPASRISSSDVIRQTDAAGNRLPFTTTFPDRWSANNAGTDYEPCTAVTRAILQEFNLDPSSVNDAADANRQTIRGCDWTFLNDTANTISQYVGGNGELTLNEYRDKQMGRSDELMPNMVINKRPVLRIRNIALGQCTVVIQSGGARVFTTLFVYHNRPSPDRLCDVPVRFLRTMIDKIPE
ncbi:hypothetical protein GCM10009624_16200 [Gordonia sinesedis]